MMWSASRFLRPGCFCGTARRSFSNLPGNPSYRHYARPEALAKGGAMRRACLLQAGNLLFLSVCTSCGPLARLRATIESLFNKGSANRCPFFCPLVISLYAARAERCLSG